jgi:hypothetical protein
MALDPKFASLPPFSQKIGESLRFHFDCYALCEIGFYEDNGEVTVDSAKLLGFWLTSEEADMASRNREYLLRDRHDAQFKVTNGRWAAWPFSDPGYVPNSYQIIPLSKVRFSSLWDLDTAIEEAAKARVNGVGVENRGAQ